ncbi:hypothetical protein [Sandaracinus amylolyticus]|uniref:Lipoprotein n=1 Tax=Sandaracinus amylolyticus TaxID=927083 RepID=A0A0F6YPN1_9BACT|nr:hypothetical protein [Sandaracinus amylolyticus]AKF11645.1 hypothetical protein DB32_008794 [Sandaracinus amylolyticus]
MHRRLSSLVLPITLAAALAACASPDTSPCGPGEAVRSSERDACVYEAAIVIESGFSCPAFAPHLITLGDLAACVDRLPESPHEREQLCRLMGARCGATPTTPREETTTGDACTQRDVPDDGVHPREVLLETLHDECVDAPGVTAGCIDDGRDDAPAFCTCRCDAPDGSDVPTCACPSGTVCEPELFVGGELAGGYCVRT